MSFGVINVCIGGMSCNILMIMHMCLCLMIGNAHNNMSDYPGAWVNVPPAHSFSPQMVKAADDGSLLKLISDDKETFWPYFSTYFCWVPALC